MKQKTQKLKGEIVREASSEETSFNVRLDEVLKHKGKTGYQFAKQDLKVPPCALTPVRKPGYDPKLSTLIRWAKILGCDVNDLFEAEGYTRKPWPPKKES